MRAPIPGTDCSAWRSDGRMKTSVPASSRSSSPLIQWCTAPCSTINSSKKSWLCSSTGGLQRHVLAREVIGVLRTKIGVNPEYLLWQSHWFRPFFRSRSIRMQKINYVHVFVKAGSPLPGKPG
jgi:hypothetical protein